MSGLFRRKRSPEITSQHTGDGSDPYLNLIATKVNDANGQPFGEVVSADSDTFIIKHRGEFFSIPAGSVTNRYGDLMLASNVDLPSARKQGQRWKDQDRKPIRENRTYDFSTERRLEQERNQRIRDEMERAREEALRALPSVPAVPGGSHSPSGSGADLLPDGEGGENGISDDVTGSDGSDDAVDVTRSDGSDDAVDVTRSDGFDDAVDVTRSDGFDDAVDVTRSDGDSTDSAVTLSSPLPSSPSSPSAKGVHSRVSKAVHSEHTVPARKKS